MRSAVRLVCPVCHDELTTQPSRLTCRACRRVYPVVAGVPQLLPNDLLDSGMRENAASWDAIADQYDSVIAAIPVARFRPIDQPLLTLAHGEVLEVGCGDGRLLAELAQSPAISKIRSVQGVDISPNMVARAGSRGLAAVVAAAEWLPFPEGSLDTVLSGYYALRFANLEPAAREIARVLRPGGSFGFTLLGRRSVALASRLAGFGPLLRPETRSLGWRITRGLEPGVLVPNDVDSAAQLRMQLQLCGLEVRAIRGTPYVPALTTVLMRLTDGRLPYLREELAAQFGFDIIVTGGRPMPRIN